MNIHGDNVGRDKIGTQINVVGDFINYCERKIDRLLTSPPFQAPVFVGREEELKTVHNRLF